MHLGVLEYHRTSLLYFYYIAVPLQCLVLSVARRRLAQFCMDNTLVSGGRVEEGARPRPAPWAVVWIITQSGCGLPPCVSHWHKITILRVNISTTWLPDTCLCLFKNLWNFFHRGCMIIWRMIKGARDSFLATSLGVDIEAWSCLRLDDCRRIIFFRFNFNVFLKSIQAK